MADKLLLILYIVQTRDFFPFSMRKNLPNDYSFHALLVHVLAIFKYFDVAIVNGVLKRF